MVADNRGRTTDEALIYVTGFAGIAPVDAKNVIAKTELGKVGVTVPEGYKFLGLRTSDGGPEYEVDAGDAIEFLESGFEISGDGAVTVKMTLAQYNATVQELIYGKAPDLNGVVEGRASAPDSTVILLLEGQYKSGRVLRREGVARVTEFVLPKDERNTTGGTEVTFKWLPHELFNNAPYWEAIVEHGAAPVEPGENQ